MYNYNTDKDNTDCCLEKQKENHMKLTILAIATSLTVATSAAAGDFDNTTASVNAEWDRFEFEIEGASDTGYLSSTVGYEALSYNLGADATGTLDVYAKHYDPAGLALLGFVTAPGVTDDFALGAAYTVAYAPNTFSVYGSAEVEYLFENEVFLVTPTVGAAYEASNVTTVWGEVGYTLDATNDWDGIGGVAKVGADFAVADNVTLTPAIVHRFDRANGAVDDTQLNLGLNLKF